jgi:hypothetical protein
MDDEKKRIDELQVELVRLQHSMQAGVAMEQNFLDPQYDHHKHLRVGVNSAMVNLGALTRLLVKKGVLTELEYWESQVEGMRDEVERYKTTIKERMGRPDIELELI